MATAAEYTARELAPELPLDAPATTVGPTIGEAVLEAMPLAVLLIDAGDRICFANPAAERLLGHSAAALTKLEFAQLTGPDGDLTSLLNMVRERGLTVSERDLLLPLHNSAQGGQEGLKVHAQIMPVTGQASEAGQILMLLHDAGAADEIDRQLAASVSTKAASGMAAVLAHEVKNPLSGIRGAAQLLAKGATEDDRRLTQLICDETDRIRELVNRMESLNDPRPGSVEPVNVHEVLDHVIDLMEAGLGPGTGITYDRQHDPSLPEVPAERDRLVQVCLNILKNAAEAVPRHSGQVEIRTRYQHGVHIALPGEGGRIEAPIQLSVTDNGPGIPEEIRNTLFNPFVTTKAGGTGLGLALVQKLVTEIGGRIDCESGTRGTTFSVNLPAWKGEPS